MAAGCVIGVDVGGTRLRAGAVDADLRVHHRAYRLVGARHSQAVIDTIVDAVTEAREAVRSDIAAVGVGLPCLVALDGAVVMACNHLDIRGVPVRDVLAERLGVPVALDHDANCALYAEARHGAARGARHAIMITVGTGVGGAVLVGGEILRGASGAAGELGHVVIDEAGPPCPGRCPNRGCLEAFVSGPALAGEGMRLAVTYPESPLGRAAAAGREITGALVTELAHDGDAAARDAIVEMGERLGVGLTGLVNVFNPEVIVLGGGLIAAGDLLLDPARRVVARRALPPARDQVGIVPARFGEESGMLGAAVLALDAIAPS
jgi:glucokinase